MKHDTILGFPIVIDEGMEEPAEITFGSLDLYKNRFNFIQHNTWADYLRDLETEREQNQALLDALNPFYGKQ